MRLTDEERRIADDVALRLYFDPMRPGDAWECALQYIQSRRKALGEVEPVHDRTTLHFGADGREIPPEGVAALCRDLHRAASALCQHHWTCESLPPDEQAAMWAALCYPLGLPPGTATAAGVGSPEVEVRVGQGDDGTGVPLTARIVRPATDAGVRAPAAEDADQLRHGDYVLAETVLPDGRKHFFVGRISECGTDVFDGVDPIVVMRYTAKDCHGIAFPVRRAEKITSEQRGCLLSMALLGHLNGESPWDYLARIRGEAKGGGA